MTSLDGVEVYAVRSENKTEGFKFPRRAPLLTSQLVCPFPSFWKALDHMT